MLKVGLTGGIGSGKSTVSGLRAQHGAVVIDYDQMARDVVAPGSAVLDEIATRFGRAVIRPDGALDRPALGAIVFGDPAALEALNAITHPAIKQLGARREASARRSRSSTRLSVSASLASSSRPGGTSRMGAGRDPAMLSTWSRIRSTGRRA